MLNPPTRQKIRIDPLAIVDRILSEIELSPKQQKDIVSSYASITEALHSTSSLVCSLRADIAPQGSVRLGTTIKPNHRNHFDLDVLCHLRLCSRDLEPTRVFGLVWRTLSENKFYSNKISAKNRCIRIVDPAYEAFHLDLIPAISSGLGDGCLLVPDRPQQEWCRTRPLEYADIFFLPATKRLPKISIILMNERVLETNSMSGSVEPLPEFGFEKMPLQRIVQLVKYDRDHSYVSDEGLRPSSILLTTIVTHSYNSLISKEFDSLFNFVKAVIEMLPSFIILRTNAIKTIYEVSNPVESSENFAEHWTHKHYARFLLWHSRLMGWLNSSIETKGKGLDVMLKSLAEGLGEQAVTKAAKTFGAQIDILHRTGSLSASVLTSGIVTSTASIPRTIYHGTK